LEQKEYAKAYLSSTYVDPVEREDAENLHQFILKKLEELERAENVQRIRVITYLIVIYVFYFKHVHFFDFE